MSVRDETNHNIQFKTDQMKSDIESREEADESEEITWQVLAVIQDRLCFYIYAITIVILVLVFLLTLIGTV